MGTGGGGGGGLSFIDSIQNVSSTVSLVGDVLSPGASTYYGTNGAGTRGFYSFPGAGSGSVTSVGLSDGSTNPIFTISGSPVTTSGTLTETLSNQTRYQIFSGPSTVASAQPSFRYLVGGDLPNPSASTLGGIESYSAVTNQWINAISTSGVPSSSQPAFSNISGTLGPSQLPVLGGDVTSSGSTVTLNTVGTAGTFTKVTVNAKGLTTSGASAVLASSDFANQGAFNQVLHGNSAGNPSWGSTVLTQDVSGILPKVNGGDGVSTLTANLPVLGNGSGPVTQGTRSGNTTVFATTSGSLPTNDCAKFDANGNIVDAGACSSGSVTSVTASSPISSSGGTTPNISLTGVVAVANGGQGNATLTARGVLIGEGTSPVSSTVAGASGTLLTAQGASADPIWTTATYPATTTVNQLLYSSATNTVGGLATFNSSVLTTSSSGVPTWIGSLTVPNGGTGKTTFTSNLPLIGNGTGAIAQGTVSGNTTEFGTVTGATVNGDCAKWDASGNLIDSGSGCGSGGGSVNSVTATGPLTSSGGANPNIVLLNAASTVYGFDIPASTLHIGYVNGFQPSLIGASPTNPAFNFVSTDELDVGVGSTVSGLQAINAEVEYDGSSATGVATGEHTGASDGASNATNFTTPITTNGGTLRGIRARAAHNGSGTMSGMTGVSADVALNSGAGALTDGAAFTAQGPTVANGTTMTNYYGFRSNNNAATGTLTNNYGVWVDNMTAGGTNWSIFSGTAQSALAGKVRIGSSSAPSSTLDVTGSFAASGQVTLSNYGVGLLQSSGTGVISSNGNQLRRTCNIVIGANNGASLLTADLAPQGQQCFVPFGASVIEVGVGADAGTNSVLVADNRNGTVTGIINAALATQVGGGYACSNVAGTSSINGINTCNNALTSTAILTGDFIETRTGTADGNAHRMSIFVTFTVN